MKVEFVETKEVVDLVGGDWLFVVMKLFPNKIREVKEVRNQPTRSNVARWWAEGIRKSACIVVVCDACRQRSTWHEANDSVRLEHCKKTEVVPKEVFEQYKRLRDTW